jgi:Trehalose utilisation
MKTIRVIVWNENIHERKDSRVQTHYPQGIHNFLAKVLNDGEEVSCKTATLEDPEDGLSESRLEGTDVLVWWGHLAHARVSDRTVDRVQKRVLEGMGLVVLHSGHYSKVFKRLLGTSCSLAWREAGEKERIWTCEPGHPIAQGLPPLFRDSARRDVQRTIRYSRTGRTCFYLLVSGRRSFSFRLLLEPRQWKDLLFSARARDFPVLPPARSPDSDPQCRPLGGPARSSVD